MFTYKQAIEAVRARLNGQWDNQYLLQIGPLSTCETEDILKILNNTDENELQKLLHQKFTVVLLVDGVRWATTVEADRLFNAQHLAIDQARALYPSAVIKIKI